MSVPPRRGTPGVLSGFSLDTAPGNTELGHQPTLITLQDVLAEFQVIRQALDPERIRQLSERIYQHTLDHNNPHGTTISDLLIDVTRDALLPYMPGTVPATEPQLSLLAALGGYLPWTCARPDPVMVYGTDGRLVNVPAGQVAIDRLGGTPRLALWGDRTNRIGDNRVQHSPNGAARNGLGYELTLAGLRAPNGTVDYLLVRDNNSSDEHGYRLTVATIAGEETVSDIHVFPLRDTGVLVLRLNRVGAETLRLDLATGAVTTSANTVLGLAEQLPTGWWRLGLQYFASTTGSQQIDLLYGPDAETLSYPGTNQDLFAVWGPNHGPGQGFGPCIPTAGEPVTVRGGAVTLPATLVGAGMLGVMAKVAPSLAPALPRELLRFDNALALRLSGPTLTATLSNQSQTAELSATLADRPERWALGWGAEEMRLVRLGGGRQNKRHSLGPLPGGSQLTLLPGNWQLERLVLYPGMEQLHELDFIAGENTQ